MRSSHIKFVLFALASVAAAFPQGGVLGAIGEFVGKKPIPPSDDPFYLPPQGFESAKPGQILNSRPVPGGVALLNLVPLQLKGSWQLLYRTSDAQGKPTVTVTTVLVPFNADPKKVINYQVAEDSGGEINCAPSYAIQNQAALKDPGTANIEAALIAAALNQGWIVNSPDWEGPKSTFVAGFQAGYATLDSIRAALASESITGVSPQAKVQMWGYSGGALASEWASELQVKYYPEAPIIGMAIGGVTPNVTNVFNRINKGPFAGIAAAGFLGLGNAYPEFGSFVQQSLKPKTAAAINQAGKQCFYADVVGFAGQDIFKYFKQGKGIFDDKIAIDTIELGASMNRNGIPQFPTFVYKSEQDEISPIADTDALVKSFCDRGVPITYVRTQAGEHFTQAATSTGDILTYLTDRFNGVPISGCTNRTVFLDDLQNPAFAAKFGVALTQVLLNAVLLPVGPPS